MKIDPKWTDAKRFVASLDSGIRMAELGVWRGVFSKMSYDMLRPEVMYLVDWWAPYSNSRDDPDEWKRVRRQALDRFKKEIKDGTVKVIEEDFVAAGMQVPAGYFDYIRHDGDEREHQVSRVLRAWWPSLKKGGIWLGHGFDNLPTHGTIPAVIKFLKQRDDAELLAVLQDHSYYVIRKTR